MYGFTMSGQVTVSCNTTVDPLPEGKHLMPAAGMQTNAKAGWWIVPTVALGAMIWALIISWAFGFG
jgi:hypothetical protein